MENDPLHMPTKDPWMTWGLTVAAVAILVIGGAVGYYFGYDMGYERAGGDTGAMVQEPDDADDSNGQAQSVTNFEECAAAGNPVMESYPRQCRSVDGRLFVEDVPPVDAPSEPVGSPRAKDGCAVGGCSSQLCGEAGEVENLVTTCEFRPEYACLSLTVCERQTDGLCGWDQNPAYLACLQAPESVK